jgi:hypothetical protein
MQMFCRQAGSLAIPWTDTRTALWLTLYTSWYGSANSSTSPVWYQLVNCCSNGILAGRHCCALVVSSTDYHDNAPHSLPSLQ